ncbi:MAG: hypothetical protein ACUVSY_18495 [Roseiflexus sp.]
MPAVQATPAAVIERDPGQQDRPAAETDVDNRDGMVILNARAQSG